MIPRFGRVAAALAGASLFFPFVHGAENETGSPPPLHWQGGVVQYHGSLETLYEYTSNVRRRYERSCDHVGILRPVVGARTEKDEEYRLETVYQLDAEGYRRNPSLDTLDHRWQADAQLGGRRLRLNASNLFVRTSDRASTVLSDRVQREEETWRAAVAGRAMSWSPELAYRSFKRIYKDDLFQSYSVASLSPLLAKDLDENHKVHAGLRYDRIYYSPGSSRNGEAYQGVLGWGYEPGRDFSARAAAGVQSRRYACARTGGFFGLVGDARARYVPRDRLALEAELSSAVQEAPVERPSGYYLERSARATADYRATEKLSLRLSQLYARQHYGDDSARADFSGRRGDDFFVTYGAATFQVLEKVSVTAGAAREQRRSNIGRESYLNHILSASCKVEL